MDALIYNKIETEAQRIIDAVASGGTAIKIGEDVVASGDSKYFLRVDLPENWDTEYDVIVGLAVTASENADWFYAPFSNTGASGAFIANDANTLYYTPLVLFKDNNKFYYKGFSNTGSEITKHDPDFFIIRLYTASKYFLEGCYLKVYGFKTNT